MQFSFSQPQNQPGPNRAKNRALKKGTSDFCREPRGVNLFCLRPTGRRAKSAPGTTGRSNGTFSSIEERIKTSAPAFGKRDCEIFHELGGDNSGHKES
jgi:hypothetical protein